MTELSNFILRRGTPDDGLAVYRVLWDAVSDLVARTGGAPFEGAVEEFWERRASLDRHLAETAAEYWVAEDAEDGEVFGYARSVENDGLFELAEFFLRPGRQSGGIGRQLLDRAFPPGRGRTRTIMATVDPRAIRSYHRVGTVARFPMFELGGTPAPVEVATDLVTRRIDHAPTDLAALDALDLEVIEHRRPGDHRWRLETREGYLFLRRGRPVGYGFVSERGFGPYLALDAAYMPAVLAQAETRAHQLGATNMYFILPGHNAHGMRHLLGRGFKIDPFITLFMSDRAFGQFDRYAIFTPQLIL
jgi:GNAT superfamily N-acetyltransferase